MDNRERVNRVVEAAKLGNDGNGAPVLWVNLEFASDPSWFLYVLKHPGLLLMAQGKPVLAHLPAGDDPAILDAMVARGGVAPEGLTVIDHDEGPQILNESLRKLECPFVEPLTPATVRKI